MPWMTKQVLSGFLRSGCERQLRLSLHSDDEREQLGMPPEQEPRPGLEHIAQAGEAWEQEKLEDLLGTFGPERVVHDRRPDSRRLVAQPLGEALVMVGPLDTFIAQGSYEVGTTFREALRTGPLTDRFDLGFADLRPDLILVEAAAATAGSGVVRAVRPDGTTTRLGSEDPRRRLRIIDITGVRL